MQAELLGVNLSVAGLRRILFLLLAGLLLYSSFKGTQFAYPRSSTQMPTWLGRLVSGVLALFAIFLAFLK